MQNKLSKEVLELIGIEKKSVYEVTEKDIRRFSQVAGVKNIQKLEDGRLVAPLLFCQTFIFEDVPTEYLPPDGSPAELNIPIPAKRAVGGQSNFEFYLPITSGDQIMVRRKLKNVEIKNGKTGLLYLITVETLFHNQNEDLVSKEIATYVKRI